MLSGGFSAGLHFFISWLIKVMTRGSDPSNSSSIYSWISPASPILRMYLQPKELLRPTNPSNTMKFKVYQIFFFNQFMFFFFIMLEISQTCLSISFNPFFILVTSEFGPYLFLNYQYYISLPVDLNWSQLLWIYLYYTLNTHNQLNFW